MCQSKAQIVYIPFISLLSTTDSLSHSYKISVSIFPITGCQIKTLVISQRKNKSGTSNRIKLYRNDGTD